MRNRLGAMLAILAVAAGVALPLSAGEELTKSSVFHFRLNSSATGSTIVLSTPSDATYFSSGEWPIAYLAGETVTATAPSGAETELVVDAPSAGTVPLTLTSGGLWQLTNSHGETAIVGVGWGVLGDSWSIGFSSDASFAMHTIGTGPDRRGTARQFPDVAYSGDSWARDDEAASTLTFVSPNGVETAMPLVGTGATTFKFSDPGIWHVTLAMSDGSETREASIQVVSVGTFIIVR